MQRRRVIEKAKVSSWRPVVGICLITATMLGIVFFKMEVRRLGYLIVKKSRDLKVAEDEKRVAVWRLSQVNRLDKVMQMAESKLTLNMPKAGQIIQMSGDQVAVSNP
jgi:hypothetical protein